MTHIVQEIIRGQAVIDQRKTEIKTVVGVMAGFVDELYDSGTDDQIKPGQYTNESPLVIKDEEGEWIMYWSTCKKSTKTTLHFQYGFSPHFEDAYAYPAHMFWLQEVSRTHRKLESLVLGLFEKFPILKDRLKPITDLGFVGR